MLYPDAECQRCADRGTVPSEFGRIRCDCTIGQTVDFIPERTPEEHRQTAYDYSSSIPGRGLALYQWASTNGEHADYDALMRELDDHIDWIQSHHPYTEQTHELDILRSLRRYLADALAPEVNYDDVPF